MTSATAAWRGARPLVIGASGFMGTHIARALSEAGSEVHGMTRRARGTQTAPIVMHAADLLDRAGVDRVIHEVRPTHVFNLAGRLKPQPADSDALRRIHVDGTRILFEALRAADMRPLVFIASSAAVYGEPEMLPVQEHAPRRTRSEYGVSKVAQEDVALAAMREHRFPVICTRSFNLVGPGLSPELVAAQVARDVARAEAGGAAVLRVGDLDHRRDFLDIRDAVRAFLQLAADPPADAVVNVCSGWSVPVRECVDHLVAAARVPVKLEIDRARFAGAVEDIYGSTALLASAIKWEDFIPLRHSLDDLLEEWRGRESVGSNAVA